MSNDSELDGELYLEIHGFIGLWLVELQVGVLVTTRGERNHLNQEISQHPFFSVHDSVSTSFGTNRTVQELESEYKGPSSLLLNSCQDCPVFCHATEWQACPNPKAAAQFEQGLSETLGGFLERHSKLQTLLLLCLNVCIILQNHSPFG